MSLAHHPIASRVAAPPVGGPPAVLPSQHRLTVWNGGITVLPANVTPGNSVLYAITANVPDADLLTVDGLGATWGPIFFTEIYLTFRFWLGVNCTGGDTITATRTGSASGLRVQALEMGPATFASGSDFYTGAAATSLPCAQSPGISSANPTTFVAWGRSTTILEAPMTPAPGFTVLYDGSSFGDSTYDLYRESPAPPVDERAICTATAGEVWTAALIALETP